MTTFATRRRALCLVLVAAAGLPLAACFTPRVQPKPSQAILEARAHRDVAAAGCAATPLATVSPTSIPFAFNEAELTDSGRTALDGALAWLACHPDVPAVVKGAADNHGTPADQEALANKRADLAAQYLQAHGLAAARLSRIAPSAAEPAGAHLLVMAEGQRW
jgi:peptidoglycan-associated lipoprotein